MRESSFIRQNKEKWKEFERILDNKYKDPDKLDDLFVQITDDLSYSRTFYPNRSVRVYLNGLAQKIFFSIYKSRKSRRSRLVHFWTDELPQLVLESRREFRLSFLLFLLSFLIGVLSSAMDPDFARIILGDAYIEMTLENIQSGDPMAVYKERGAFGMSIGITANNLFVAFLTFVSGVFFAIGSIGILIRNGVMVGVFQYFFIERELFWESFLTIWIHGTLEISAIIIAGAAGITMGKGLAFPGTLSRLKSFQLSARRGLKIMVGIAPIFVIAGFIEGYLTRHNDTPEILRGAFILLCLAFVLGYFVWYPRYKARVGFKPLKRSTELPPDHLQDINLTQIKTSGELFADTFVFYRQNFGYLLGFSALTAALYCLVLFPLVPYPPDEMFYFPAYLFGTLEVLPFFFYDEEVLWLPVLHVGLLTFLTFFLMRKLVPLGALEPKQGNFIALLKTAIGAAAMTGLLITMKWYTVLFLVFIFPIVLLWIFIMNREELGAIKAFARTFSLLSGQFGRIMGLGFILSLIGFLFFLLLDTAIIWLLLESVAMNFALDQESMTGLAVILLTFLTMTFLFLTFGILLIGSSLAYFTLLEVQEAPYLRGQINKIGLQKRIQGLAKED